MVQRPEMNSQRESRRCGELESCGSMLAAKLDPEPHRFCYKCVSPRTAPAGFFVNLGELSNFVRVESQSFYRYLVEPGP